MLAYLLANPSLVATILVGVPSIITAVLSYVKGKNSDRIAEAAGAAAFQLNIFNLAIESHLKFEANLQARIAYLDEQLAILKKK